MAGQIPTVGGSQGNASDSGYQQDISRRTSNLIGEDDNDSISSKEEGYQRDDSRDLEDMAEEDGACGEHKTERPAIARKRVKQRVNTSGTEETQIIPLSLGHYVDHSLDPILDDPHFAPLQRMANFTEKLFAILSNESLSNIITWMPHGRSFTILDRSEFVRSVLPTYYRTARMGSFSKQLNGYGFNKIKLGVNQYTHYNPCFLRGLPHLVKSIKRNATGTAPSLRVMHNITEADLERMSAEAPVPDRVSATCSANAAIQRINQQYDINQLQEEPSEPLWARAPIWASLPIPPHTMPSNILASQRPTSLPPPVTSQLMLPLSATSQFQNIAPPANSPFLFGAYNLPPLGRVPAPEIPSPAGWDGVTNALLQTFQSDQVERQIQEQTHQAQLTLLINALAAELQNARSQSQVSYPPLTPSQLGVLSSALAILNSVPNIPSAIYTPRWLPVVQQPPHNGTQNSTLNDCSDFVQNND